MTTSEPTTAKDMNVPTTGEIVRALRYCTDENSICGTACPAYLSEAGCRTTVIKNAADRLESQEQKIAALTARAEQAEADIKKFAHTSHTCGHNESGLCKLAADDHGFCEKCPAWVYRGQPQDGEGL